MVQIIYKFDVEAISGAVKALSMISKVSERSEAKRSELDTTSLWCETQCEINTIHGYSL